MTLSKTIKHLPLLIKNYLFKDKGELLLRVTKKLNDYLSEILESNANIIASRFSNILLLANLIFQYVKLDSEELLLN